MRFAPPVLIGMFLVIATPAISGPLEDAELAFEARDFASALKIWGPLAEAGNAQAQFGLGALYHEEKNDNEAMKWYRSAADQGYPRAQHHLGFLYFAGLHVPKDYVLSYMWENLAAAQGEKGASDSRDSVASLMTPDQIAEAQRLSREWKPRK